MTELTQSSNLKKQDYAKWAKAQPLETLEEEMREVELKLTDLQHRQEEIDQPESGTPLWLCQHVEGQIADATRHIDDLRRELTARRIQGVSALKHSASPGEVVAARQSIVCSVVSAANGEKVSTQAICIALDSAKVQIPLPPGADWEPYRNHENPWYDAYTHGGKKLQAHIRTIFWKDKDSCH